MSDASFIGDPSTPVPLQFRLQWVGDMVSSPAPVNQAMISADLPVQSIARADSHVVTFGYVAPPMIFAEMSPAEMEAVSAQPLPVMASGRFLFSTERLRELRDQIDQHLAQNPSA